MGGAEPNEYAYNGPDPVHNKELRLGKRVWFLMNWCELYEKCVSFGENVTFSEGLQYLANVATVN